MVFAQKQKEVTKDCVASTDKDYWLVGSEGDILRPSNWPERIASTFMQMDEFASRKKLVSQCVSQVQENGRFCLKVRKAFQEGCIGGWGYVESFAKSNNLSIIDNSGQVFTPEENTPVCDELESLNLTKES